MGFIIFTSVVLVIAAKNMKSIKDMKEEIPDETALKNEHSKEIGNKSQLVNETRQSNLTTTGYTSSPIPASTDKEKMTTTLALPRPPSFTMWSFCIGFVISTLVIGMSYAGFRLWQNRRNIGSTYRTY